MRFQKLILIAIFFAHSSYVFAWGEMGHKIVGIVAEETMSKEAKDMVRGIIGIEPLYVSAIWPDLVRDDARFGTRTNPADPGSAVHDFAPFHFCEVPVGFDYKSKPNKIEKDCHSAMKYTLDLIKDPKNLRETKMIALRYLIHVVGDVHHPLHVGNAYDRGGNACQIFWNKSGSPKEVSTKMNLHFFWDETMVDYVREGYAKENQGKAPRYAGEFFRAIKKKNPDLFMEKAKEQYGSGSLVDWIMESQSAREGIYPDKAEDMKDVKKGEEYKNRPYCLWYLNQDTDKNPAPGSQIIEAKIPTLTSVYADQNAAYTEMQLIKAGLRLAYLLDQAALEMKSQPDTPKLDDQMQESILKKIQDTLKNIFSVFL